MEGGKACFNLRCQSLRCSVVVLRRVVCCVHVTCLTSCPISPLYACLFVVCVVVIYHCTCLFTHRGGGLTWLSVASTGETTAGEKGGETDHDVQI